MLQKNIKNINSIHDNSLQAIQEFVTDVINRFFRKYNIKYGEHDNCDLWLLHYFNFRLKFIEPIKRQVNISTELETKLKDHPKKSIFNAIVQRALNGSDLNPFQSKGSFNSDRDDGLFNDWGIHHLHLNMNKINPIEYFNKRSDELVFVRFTTDAAYFIDMHSHNEKNLWSKKDLISIIQNNWNEIIQDKEIPDLRLTPDFNDEEIGTLREKGYLTGVMVNEKSYLLLGHGQTSSGDNMMAGRLSDNVIRWIGLNKEMYEVDKRVFELELLKQLWL